MNVKEKDKYIFNVIKLQDCLREDKPLPEFISTWLLCGLNKLQYGEVKTLDEGLNLKPTAGLGKVGTRMRKLLRDTYIKELIQVTGNNSDSLWARCGIAGELINRFPDKIGRLSKTPVENQTKQERILLGLFKLYPYGYPPSTQKTLYEICTL